MDEKETIKVIIVDDHRLILEGLRMVLEREGMQVLGAATTGRQAVEKVLKLHPDVVLLDIRMPDMDGLEALEEIKSARKNTAVIMLTSYPHPDYLARAVALGAAGFLSKDCDPAQIPEAIKAVVAGDAIVDLQLLQASLGVTPSPGYRGDGVEGNLPNLTQQEHRILTLIAEGYNNNEIADTLSVSKNTVKSHVQNVFRKLGVSDRTQAAIFAIRSGLAPIDSSTQPSFDRLNKSIE
jgi:DNA-binding NarL/FixJ family response regulator